MKKRYFIDCRVGCIAIRDSEHPDYNPDYPGLHNDTVDVVECWHGKKKNRELLYKWYVPKRLIRKAKKQCAILNRREANK